MKKKERFSVLFDKHYSRLFGYALKVIKERETSEGLVQDTFIKLWENIENINDEDRSIESYLIITLKNKIIDLHRKSKTREKHIGHFKLEQDTQSEMDAEWDLSQRISDIYQSLDEKTVVIFKLSREKGLTYKEIAEQGSISVKSVEQHISKALSAFRKGLKEFL